MATTVLTVLSLILLFRATFSLSVSLDVSSVQSSESVRNIALPERISALDLEDLVQSKLVQSFDTSSAKLLRRKREAIVNHSCPEGSLWFANRCMTYEEYRRLTEDYEDR